MESHKGCQNDLSSSPFFLILLPFPSLSVLLQSDLNFNQGAKYINLTTCILIGVGWFSKQNKSNRSFYKNKNY